MTFEEQEFGERHIFHRSIFPLLFQLILIILAASLAVAFLDVIFLISGARSMGIIAFKAVLSFLLIAFFVGLSAYATARWLSDLYIIDAKELVLKYGILFIREQRYNLSEIAEITQNQSILGKWLNYGEIRIKRPREEEIVLINMPDPKHILSVLEKNTGLGK